MIDLTSYLLGKKSGGGSTTLIEKTITENDTYNASDDNADGYSSVTVNVSGGTSEKTFYAFNHKTNQSYNTASYGIKFIPKIPLIIKGIRIMAPYSTENVYLSLANGTLVVQKTDVSVNIGEWNDVFFDNPITLTSNTEYVVWASDAIGRSAYTNTLPSKEPFIQFVDGAYSSSANTFPSSTWSGRVYGVDLIVCKSMGPDKYPFYTGLYGGMVPYSNLTSTITIDPFQLPDWVNELSDNTKDFINDNCKGCSVTGTNYTYILDDRFTAFSLDEYLSARAFQGDIIEYPSYIYGSSLLSQYNITLLGDFSQGGADTGNVLSDSITNYSAIILQGIYKTQRTSQYNTTALYPITLNESF